MAITLVRVDDRGIHGQTMTRWASSRPCNAVIVISDEVAADPMAKKVYRLAVGSLGFGVFNVAKGVGALDNARASAKNFFVISTSIKSFADVVRAGGDIGKVLNIGSYAASRPGTKHVGTGISINEEDVENLDYLASQGIDIQFQMVPDNSVTSWAQIKAKYESLS